MSEQFLLEDGSGSYFLEDSSGGYRQDFPIVVTNDSIGITETKVPEFDLYLIEDGTGAIKLESGLGYYKINAPISNITDTVGTIETVNHVRVLKQEINDIIGLTETKNRLRNQVRNLDEVLQLTETKRRLRSIIKNIVHFDFDNYSVEDGSGNLELESGLGNYAPDKTNVSEVIGLAGLMLTPSADGGP